MRFTLAVLLISFLLLGFTQAEKCSVGCSCPWKAAFFKVPKGSCKTTKVSIAATYNKTLTECRAKGLCRQPFTPVKKPKCGKGKRFSKKSKKCVKKRCPRLTKWSKKSKRCVPKQKCAKGSRFSRKVRMCVTRKCGKGQKWSKKQKKCRASKCKKSQRWSKKSKKCITKRCPRKYRWVKKTKRCVKRSCGKGKRWSKKQKKCIKKRCPKFTKWNKKSKRCAPKRKCAKGQRFSRKQKKCVARRCGKGTKWSKKQKKCRASKCKKTQRWSKKSKKCVTKKCPRKFRWSLKAKRCVKRRCPRPFVWGKKAKRCYRKCAKGQRFSKKQKKCVTRKCGKKQRWSKVANKCVAKVCPKGFKLNKKSDVCIKKRRCPKGFKFSKKSKKCVKRRCAKGQKFSKKQKKCVPKRCTKAQKWSKKQKKCVPKKCKVGKLVNGKCVKKCPPAYKFSKKLGKCVKKKAPITRVTCELYADPHARAFNGQRFEAQTVGDWLLYEGEKVSSSYRGKSFGRWVGVVQWVAKVNGDVVRSVGFQGGVTVNGQKVALKDGVKFPLKDGAFILKNKSKITVQTGDNKEVVDYISYGYFFNAYVHSKSKKPKGICSKQFIASKDFLHPQKPVVIKPGKPKCPNKRKFKVQCQQKKLTGKALDACVFDRCAGLPEKIEKQIIKDNKKEDKPIPVKPIKLTCDTWADPHARSFKGKGFEAQTEGDWLMYKGKNMKIAYRGKRMSKVWVGIVQYVVRIRNQIFRSSGFDKVQLDGKNLNLVNNKKFDLVNGGFILKSGSKFTFSTGSGEEVDFIAYGYFFNSFVRSNVRKTSGLCDQQFIKSNAFLHPQKPVIFKPKPVACPKKAQFQAECAKKGLKGVFLKDCVKDRCAGFPAKLEDKILKDIKKENAKPIPKPAPKTVLRCDLFADPHVKGLMNQNYEAQTPGDWLLYKGKRLSVDYRGVSFGGWVGVTDYIVKIDGKVLRHNGFSDVSLNGKALNLNNGQKVELGKQATVQRNGNKFTFSTGSGEEADFISYGSFYNVYIRTTYNKSTGVCAKQFIASTAFNHPKKPDVKPPKPVACPKKAKYQAECKKYGLIGAAYNNCVQDRCKGFPAKFEKEVLKEKAKEDLKKPKRPHALKCDLYADPHVKSFDNKYYEAQMDGDWVLYKGDRLEVHYRGKRFGGWVGPVEFMIKMDGQKLRNVGFNGVSLNGNKLNLVNGKRENVGNAGAFVVMNGNKFTFSTNDGEEVDFISYGSFYNAYVRSTALIVSGVCVSATNFPRSNAFNHPQKGHQVVVPKKPCPRKANFQQECRGYGLNGNAFENCVRDRCAGFSKKLEKKIMAEKKKEEKLHVARPKPKPVVQKAHNFVPTPKRGGRRTLEVETLGKKSKKSTKKTRKARKVVRRSLARRVLYKFGKHIRTLCRRGVVLSSTPRKMVNPLWRKYVSVLKGKAKKVAKRVNKKFVRLYIKNTLSQQCKKCSCSSVFKGAKLQKLKKIAKKRCQ